MVRYQVKTPWWLRRIYGSNFLWRMPPADIPTVYLTFDDGPHPEITPFVLDHLQQHNAKATFFCIGKNIAAHPDIYQRIITAGHTTGNHTHNHLNGWETEKEPYLDNIRLAAKEMNTRLFRPPYGKIKFSQGKALADMGWTVCMWDVLSADFDKDITPQQCLENVVKNAENGSIIVFHDSEKAYECMAYALPRFLQYCTDNKWQMKALPEIF